MRLNISYVYIRCGLSTSQGFDYVESIKLFVQVLENPVETAFDST